MIFVRLVLITTLLLLILGNSKSQRPDELVSLIKDRQLINKDGVTSDYRQSRMALQAESPSSKAKREQIFRNRLALRRRQSLSSSRFNVSKSIINNSIIGSRVLVNISKDPLDLLEVQETRHSIYVTASSGNRTRVNVDNDEDLQDQSTSKINIEEDNQESSVSNIDQNNTTIRFRKDAIIKKSTQLFPRIQKHSDDSTRRKNTVAMPESLYNHFRPVESNIPIEDMTQFRYFGQKIRLENTTSNNSVEITSTSPVSINLRRRFLIKSLNNISLSTPISKLEEVTNEEMNIALDKSTIDKNKISKVKNAFRTTSLYLRKNSSNKLSELVIGSNVIETNKSVHDQIDNVKSNIAQQVNVSTNVSQEKYPNTNNDMLKSETTNSNDVTTSFPYSEEYQSDESIMKSDKLKIFLQNEKIESIPHRDRVVDYETKTTTKTTIFKEKMQIDKFPEYSSEIHDLLNKSMLTVTSSLIKDKLSLEPERISTWLSINSDPVTLSLREFVTLRSVNKQTTPTIPLLHRQPSSLRIIVTEPTIETSQDQNYRNTVNTGNFSVQKEFSTTISSISTSDIITSESSVPTSVAISNNQVTSVALTQQMYPYAYTITNVTRLLGNYSEPKIIEKLSTISKLTTSTTVVRTDEKVTLFPPLSTMVNTRESTRTPSLVSVVPTAAVSSTSSSSLLVGERGRIGTTFPQHVATVQPNTSNPLVSTTKILNKTQISDQLVSTIKWNHTLTEEITQGEIISEKKYLKKSASAVLNQRVSDNLNKDFISQLFDLQKFHDSPHAEEKNNSLSNETKRYKIIDFLPFNNINNSGNNINNKTIDNNKMEKMVENKTISLIEIITKSPKIQIHEPKDNENDSITTIRDDQVNFSAISRNTSVSIHNQITMNDRSGNLMITSPSSVIEKPTIRPLTSTTSIIKTTTATTSKSIPIFPVTPSVLNNSQKTEKEEETMDLSIEGEKILDRPFGIAKDLDPSEIQKMYRSQTTLKTEPTMTTLPTTILNPMTSQPKMDITTKKSNERSPEVRGRNLSDKTKDKDDILPIMHLYNTSNIFNGTESNLTNGANIVKTILTSPKTKIIEMTMNPNEKIITKNTSQVIHLEERDQDFESKNGKTGNITKNNKNQQEVNQEVIQNSTNWSIGVNTFGNKTKNRPNYYIGSSESNRYNPDLNSSFYVPKMTSENPRDLINISEVITRRHDGDTLATQETVTVVSYILATLVVFPIAVGVGLILRRLIIKNRKVLEESDTSSEISCRKDALNLENGDFKTSIEKTITKLPRIQHLCHELEKPSSPLQQESRWEFPREKLRLQTVLGQGNFGQVWKAEADDLTGHKGTTRLVAVKTVKEGASTREKEDLIRELEIMQQLGNHPNVVTLLGCCTGEEPHYLILEYVMYGKLLAYLRDHRTRQDFYNFSEDSAALTSRDLTVFGYCVARGMEYLASKKIIHRDLAARNVLVDHNKLCKIADFGMSRFANEDGECIETRHGRNALPIRWMAPESLIYSLFTTKTDVWSFGILMWEIVTLGSTPYPDMAAREVMRNVQDGYRLERPSHCRSELFRVIARCWHADPDRRPEFQMLRRDLAQLLEDNMNGHYVDLESFASECTD
ncbi:serine-rich adhesin for platelets-like [Chelonus insularis]|uniref:serine-rich adhesin for platelets-like n=1 Tax=Chelonus insularis TaxID=460826 RepID=UPI00158BD76F|nr:serine-rich adhesin for platelets-like [Chelonus insularis]